MFADREVPILFPVKLVAMKSHAMAKGIPCLSNVKHVTAGTSQNIKEI
jgi:hypothetical protein